MGLIDTFKRLFGGETRQEAAQTADERIDEFWAFWARRRDALAEVVGKTEMPDDLIEEVTEAVNALHPDLAWEFGPGVRAEEAFAVCGEGDANLRLLAERWRAAAPEDPGFDFFSTRQPMSEPWNQRLTYEGVELPLSDLRFRTERDDLRRIIHLQAYHPRFPDMDREAAGRALFIMLDQALGEDGVERWLGGIEAVLEPVADERGLAALLEEVDEVSKLDPEQWAVVESEGDEGEPEVFLLNLGLKRWDHPWSDTWCVVRLPYDGNEQHMPSSAQQESLNELEDGLREWLGDDAVYVGRRTGGDERKIFFYVSGAAGTADRLLAWTRGCGREARLEVTEDPSWQQRPHT